MIMENKEKAMLIEKSIQKKFHKELFSRFAKAVRDYGQVRKGDKIAVCISGGKAGLITVFSILVVTLWL